MRIVSLVPSLTELLYTLDLEDNVVGITKFCIHPEKWFRNKKRVGGTKTVDLETVEALKPDIIIANKEENQKEQIEALQKTHTVLLTDINNLEEAYAAIIDIGKATHREEKAHQLVAEVRNAWHSCQQKFAAIKPKKTLYLIWRKPYMAAGTKTFIHEVLNTFNFQNCLTNTSPSQDFTRYPELTNEEIKALNPEVIFLSSEPYPFKNKHIQELQALVPSANIHLVDGEAFSWYGSRMLYAPAHFTALCERICYI